MDVPEDAIVWLNDQLTHKTPTHREYLSPDLKEGSVYRYFVRVAAYRNGKVEESTQVVDVRLGDFKKLAFNFPARDPPMLAAAR